ncbi:MAG: type IX secretion system sortase PorU [Candidatus Eisenbacteria bacterium]|nr:type IX secretion system sortase PorU [Candidatus Eisenbacteria bacterium]
MKQKNSAEVRFTDVMHHRFPLLPWPALVLTLILLGTGDLAGVSSAHETVTLLRSSPDIIEFEFNMGQVQQSPLPGGGETVTIEDCNNLMRNGEPALPRKEVLLGVRDGSSIDVTFSRLETADVGEIVFEGVNSDARGRFPAAPVELASVSSMRNQRVASIIITPVEFDAGRKTTVLTKRMIISVRMKGGRAPSYSAEKEPLESIYSSALLNYESARAWRVQRKGPAKKAFSTTDYFNSSQNWVKLYVEESGLYAVTPSLLRSAGVDQAAVAAIDPSTLRVFSGSLTMLDEAALDSALPSWMDECAILGSYDSDAFFEDDEYVAFFALSPSGWLSGFSTAQRSRSYYENIYTRYSVLWLTWGGSFTQNPLPRAMTERSAAAGARSAFESFPERIHLEQNRFHDATLIQDKTRVDRTVKWEKWWWEVLHDTDPPTYKILRLPGIVASTPVKFLARFWGESNVRSSFYNTHYLNLMWNSLADTLASVGWNGGYKDPSASGRIDIVRTIDPSSFRLGELDTLFMDIPLIVDPSLPSGITRDDQTYLAFFEFDYERQLKTESNRLGFGSTDSTGNVTYSVSGVTSASGVPQVYALDVTDWRNPVKLTGIRKNQAGTGSYTIEIDDDMAGSPRRYWICTLDGMRSPVKAEVDDPPLNGAGATRWLRAASEADYIVVVGDKLKSGVEPLRSLRSRRLPGIGSPKVEVITMSDIYDEFAWGMVDPTALRNFLRFAYAEWLRQPSFIVFVGDATRDYKDFEGTHIENQIPTYQNGYDQYTSTQYVTDDWFALMDTVPTDNLLDLAVGRVPAKDLAELGILLNKIITYEESPESGDWRSKVILVADDTCKRQEADNLAWTHVLQAERLSIYLPAEFDRKKVYLTEFQQSPLIYPDQPVCKLDSKPKAKEMLKSLIGSGALIFNFVGHGGADLLADEDVFRDIDVGTLTNGRRLHLFISASCAVGKFDEPTTEGIGEAILKFAGGGSIASFAATDLAFPGENSALNTSFFDNLFPLESFMNPVALGVATMLAKNHLRSSINSQKYVLLGDPGLVLSAPSKQVTVQVASDYGDTLKAGSRATVSGEVLLSGTKDSSFNGFVKVEVRDLERKRGILPNATYTQGVDYYLEGAPIFRGEFPVSAGSFSGSFVVPVELTPRTLPRTLDTLVVVKPASGRVKAYVYGSAGDGVGIKFPTQISIEKVTTTDSIAPTIALRFEGKPWCVIPGANETDRNLGRVRPGSKLTVRISDESGMNITGLTPYYTIHMKIDNGAAVDLTESFEYDAGSSTVGSFVYSLPSISLGPHTISVRASDNLNHRREAGDLNNPIRFAVVDVEDIKTVFNFPNPFSEWTDISFELTQPSEVTIKIFTVSGRQLRILKTAGEIGQNNVRWDGLDETGIRVANGLYIYKISAKGTASGKTATSVGRAVMMR